jgi:hypothetical protein
VEKCTGVVLDSGGNPLSGVTVTVRLAGTATIAAIYSANTTGAPMGNPFTNAANGAYAFYAANGRYDIFFFKVGVTFVNEDTTDILLHDH